MSAVTVATMRRCDVQSLLMRAFDSFADPDEARTTWWLAYVDALGPSDLACVVALGIARETGR